MSNETELNITKYVDNTMRYCVEKIKSSNITYNDIEIDKIVHIYANCTIHPICADLKNYKRFDNVFEPYINTKIECPDIKCNIIKSLKKIQYKDYWIVRCTSCYLGNEM